MADAANTPTPESGTASHSDEEYDNKCIFCKILKGEMGTELLHSVSMLSEGFFNCKN